MRRRTVECLQSGQIFLNAKFGTKVPQGANVAHIDFTPPPFELRNAFYNSRESIAILTSCCVSSSLLDGLGITALSDLKDLLQ
jgi:hypothetical protein